MLVNIAISPEVDREPVSVAEFKAHSRITATDEDDDISLKVTAARVHIENDLGRALITSKWEYYISAWPTYPAKSYIELPLGNLQSVDSVIYTDSDGVEHTWDSDDYRVSRAYTSGESDTKAGRLHYAHGGSWPSDALDVGEAIKITFTCGWLTASDVPRPIKAAIMLLAGHWYEHREAVIVGDNTTIESRALEMAVDALLAPYRILRIA